MSEGFIPSHGNYKKLKSYQKSLIVYDGSVCFCSRFFSKFDRTVDQMVQAARSGKQNIIEGCMASGTSKQTEIKLVNVARASLEELLEDYYDYLRSHQKPVWEKESKEALFVRNLAYRDGESYETYREFIETRSGDVVANIMICLIHQCNFLLDRQIKSLEKAFVNEGGIRERMTQARLKERNKGSR